MSVKWAVVISIGYPKDSYPVPEGCEVVAYAAHGSFNDRTNYWVIRCADAEALTRLRQKEDDWPLDHIEDPEDPTWPFCGAEKSVVLEYGRSTTKVRVRCTNCGDTWTWDNDHPDQEWYPQVEVFPTRQTAIDSTDDRSLAGFLGI